MSRAHPTTAGELAAVLAANAAAPHRRKVRIQGGGTRPRFAAAEPPDALTLSLSALTTIERLEPDDLTCSVQPGVRCRDLAAALASKRLELGGLREDDPGTIGGLYAVDPLGPAVPGAACPRSTLLGAEGVLADGTVFRSGARVVKSVAGFDVHRLLVGSRGRMFAATLLHLKLRPAPLARATFATAPLALDAAVAQFLALRRADTAPQRLLLARDHGDTAVLRGVVVGRPRFVDAALRRHGLEVVATPFADHLAPSTDHELVVGTCRAVHLRELLALLPPDAPFVAHAGGHFETALPPARTDLFLRQLPRHDAYAAVALGSPARLGLSTPLDDGVRTLQRRLTAALDPHEVLL